jgi:hypothetical protein
MEHLCNELLTAVMPVEIAGDFNVEITRQANLTDPFSLRYE